MKSASNYLSIILLSLLIRLLRYCCMDTAFNNYLLFLSSFSNTQISLNVQAKFNVVNVEFAFNASHITITPCSPMFSKYPIHCLEFKSQDISVLLFCHSHKSFAHPLRSRSVSELLVFSHSPNILAPSTPILLLLMSSDPRLRTVNEELSINPS